MDVKILVATHKKYWMPEDDIYLPIHVGKEGKDSIGFIGDNTGENISEKNDFFNEMTGVYWAWKNLQSEYIGLVHYRRYFSMKSVFKRLGFKEMNRLVISREELEKELIATDIVLPTKRKYYIETIESHFLHLPYTVNEDLDVLRSVIQKHSPEYLQAFEMVMQRSWAHMFNMFIMRKELFTEYCEWAFPILNEVNNSINHEGRTNIQNRCYVSEFMIDTWIETNKKAYKELPVVFIEKENMFKKAIVLIKRKILKT